MQHAVMAGDQITGASAFRVESGLDTGPVFGVVTESIGPRDTAGELLTRLAESGALLLLATVDAIAAGTVQPVAQPADGVSLAPKIAVDDARVEWSLPASVIDRRIRGCTPVPGAWTNFRGERMKLGPVAPTSTVDSLAPGELRVERDGIVVGAAAGGAVRLGDVQPPGKRPMSAADWARGARPASGEHLE